jgi:CRP-like cAMP-binding protein
MIAPGKMQPQLGVPDRFQALRVAPLLRDFTDVGVRILAVASKQRTVGRSTYIFRSGEPADGLSIIARGTVQLRGREGGSPLGELSVGDSLGGMSLLSGGEHLLSAWAVNDVELILLTRESFEVMRKEKPRAALKLQLALATDLAERMRDAKAPLREFLAWQVSKRQG